MESDDQSKVYRVEAKIEATQARIDSIALMLEQNNRAIEATEVRMVSVVRDLADRLEKTTETLQQTLLNRNEKDEDRINTLERKATSVATVANVGVFVLPLVLSILFFVYQRQESAINEQIRFSPEEVLELREQLADLKRHRQLNGEGANFISPARRNYDSKDRTNLSLREKQADYTK
jgi:hypothetical protein